MKIEQPLDSDALIKHVFDNLRNTFLCSALALAAGAIIKYQNEVGFTPESNIVIAFFVIASALVLFCWNLVHGVVKVVRPAKGTRKLWVLVPLSAAYMLALITLFPAVIRAQTEQQLTKAVKNPHQNSVSNEPVKALGAQ